MKKQFAMALLLCAAVGLSSCADEIPAQPNELQTPQYTVSPAPETDFEAMPEEEIHGAGAVKVIDKTRRTTADAPQNTGVTPENIWQEDATVTYNAFTLPEKAAFSEDGSIGILSIPELQLTVNVYEAADEMEAMDLGAAHFKSTSAWDGNVGISAHNVNFNGTDGYFKNLHQLSAGDTLTYETALGARNYAVTKVKTISADDWNGLSRSTENRITLITCISGQPDKRLMVQAEQVQ
ncbi:MULTISPECIES: class D sortase [Anaerotruncus]|uniref:class D sortase n=1 Tax=Anaerotruncus TaxID=244127 RepID=UPI0013145F2D|nr:class D sortase [Anaerotruncus sp. AF02-27]GKH48137.1 hypothetical protein CE91St45_26990 [Oscillospiraceae bacterium]